mmetsp:Transcript_5843/g.16450  ORF Transcript_5843/g.16450 Transcript_5843/m.16450 type:complete len:275 (+) Transcript_5843:45-869(+)
MGTTQTKLHYKVLKQVWASTHAHLSTPAGQRNARQVNPLGDTPLHLCCYGGQAPPSIIRALILAYPAATTLRNKEGYLPVELARINYGREQVGAGAAGAAVLVATSRSSCYRREVLDLLDDRENGFLDMAMRAAEANGTGSAIVLGTSTSSNAASHPDQNQDDGGHLGDAGVGKSAMMMTVTTAPEHTFQTSTTCVVCLDSKADYVVVPCGHVCLCQPCSVKVRRTGLCPVGRCVVGNVLKVEDEEETDGDCVAVAADADANAVAAVAAVAPVC